MTLGFMSGKMTLSIPILGHGSMSTFLVLKRGTITRYLLWEIKLDGCCSSGVPLPNLAIRAISMSGSRMTHGYSLQPQLRKGIPREEIGGY